MTSLIVCESNSCFPNKYIHSFIRKQEKKITKTLKLCQSKSQLYDKLKR